MTSGAGHAPQAASEWGASDTSPCHAQRAARAWLWGKVDRAFARSARPGGWGHHHYFEERSDEAALLLEALAAQQTGNPGPP